MKLDPLDSNNLITAKDFEQTLTFRSPIPTGWAVMQYKSALEIVRQKDEEIESLKDITELAVKGIQDLLLSLKTIDEREISIGLSITIDSSNYILSEIERLQNAK